MITDKIVEQAANNVYRKKAEEMGYTKNKFHLGSFTIGLAVGLIVCSILIGLMF